MLSVAVTEILAVPIDGGIPHKVGPVVPHAVPVTSNVIQVGRVDARTE